MAASKQVKGRPRIQPRLSIDEDMEDFYDWVADVPPPLRSREIIAAARSWVGLMKAMRLGTALSADALHAGPAASVPCMATQPGATRSPALDVSEADVAAREVDRALQSLDPNLILAGPPLH